jgi:hypothetical protein
MPFIRRDANGVETITLDFALRAQMVLSARMQLTYAACHLLRGHLTEIFGHARRAIEGAGIAYLSSNSLPHHRCKTDPCSINSGAVADGRLGAAAGPV